MYIKTSFSLLLLQTAYPHAPARIKMPAASLFVPGPGRDLSPGRFREYALKLGIGLNGFKVRWDHKLLALRWFHAAFFSRNLMKKTDKWHHVISFPFGIIIRVWMF